MSRMFYRICESMYCSIVRVRVWTALCVFKTFVLPWQRLRKKFKPMGLSQLTNLTLNLLKISQNSETDTRGPHTSQLRPLTSSEDTKSISNIISITKWYTLFWGYFEDIYKVAKLGWRRPLSQRCKIWFWTFFNYFLGMIKIILICYQCLHLNLMESAERGAPAHLSYAGAVP